MDFHFLLSVLKALFYLTVGKWLLNKAVKIQNVKIPRGSVNILSGNLSLPQVLSDKCLGDTHHMFNFFSPWFVFPGEKGSEDWWKNAFTKRRGTTKISQ